MADNRAPWLGSVAGKSREVKCGQGLRARAEREVRGEPLLVAFI